MTVNASIKSEVRIQDIVAKTARVNLRDTVRVLRALAMILKTMEENGAASRLNHLLYQSARYGQFPGPLHTKPDATSIEACDDFYDEVVDEYGSHNLKALFDLTDDPYFNSKVKPAPTSGD